MQSPTQSPSACRPRRRIAAPGESNLADLVQAYGRLIGYDLTPWQLELVADWSALDARGKFVNRNVGASVPRQAGKSAAGIVWAAFLADRLGYNVLWTDHNYSTTCEMLGRFRAVFGKRPNDPNAPRALNARLKDASSKTSQESMTFANGAVLCFSTRTDSAALGYSFDAVFYDEAQLLTTSQTQTIAPTTSHAPHANVQFVYLGTPTRAGCNADVFRDLRKKAWADEPPDAVAWTEYGADEVGNPWDESRWPAVNPTLACGAISADNIRAGITSLSDPVAAAQEYLGYWLPEVQLGADPPVLLPGEWDGCRVAAAPAPCEGERVAYGVKFAPDGSTVCLAAAVQPPAKGAPAHVELVERRQQSEGTEWLAEWLLARSAAAAAVMVDGRSGTGPLMERLKAAPRGYVVQATTANVIDSSASMLERVRTRAVTHISQPALDESAATSTRRGIGKAGGWGWGGDDPTPIEAASLALEALKSKRDPRRRSRLL